MNRVPEILKRRGLSPTQLARRAGLSRQALYRFLDPAYDPFPLGFRRVAAALAVSPGALVSQQVSDLESLVREAATDDARAFELLPATVHAATPEERRSARAETITERRLLAAAGEFAQTVAPSSELRRWVDGVSRGLPVHSPFLFGARWMDVSRIAAATPEPLARHHVYGAFEPETLRRHFR